MEHSTACGLIKNAFIDINAPEIWLDLGCGVGVFTYALAEMLPNGSKILAIDKYPQDIDTSFKTGVEIQFHKKDFTEDLHLRIAPDGILIGNALHYVEDKVKLLTKLIHTYPGLKKFLLFEYDTDNSNYWVPYPITYPKMLDLFKDVGFNDVEKISEHPSIYNDSVIYGVVIRSSD